MKPFILSCLILMTLAGRPAAANELQEIRTGKYDDFARIVFQFKSPARFEIQNDEGHTGVSLIMMDTASTLSTDPAGKFPEPIESIRLEQNGPHLASKIALSKTGYHLKSFTLEGPDRIVLDIHATAVLESKVILNPIVISETKSPEPIESQAKKPDSQPENTGPEVSQEVASPTAEIETTVTVAADKSSADTPRVSEKQIVETPRNLNTSEPAATPATVRQTQATDTREEPVSKTSRFQQYLIAVFGGISIIILALVGFLLFHKKQSSGDAVSDQTREELKTTADIMASIDAKIKDKFKQYETSNQE